MGLSPALLAIRLSIPALRTAGPVLLIAGEPAPRRRLVVAWGPKPAAPLRVGGCPHYAREREAAMFALGICIGIGLGMGILTVCHNLSVVQTKRVGAQGTHDL